MKADFRTLLLLLCLAAPALSAAEPVNRFALIIGITGYPNFRAEDRLKYADSDARLFAKFLESDAAGGFPSANVRLLLNEKATRTAIYREIDWIGTRATSNDIVYVYFAGHGVVDNSDRAFFMPYDADPTVPGAEGLRADEFMRTLREQISARQEIFFVDACHAGAAYGPNGATRRDAPNIVPKLRALWQAQPPGGELNMAFLSTASNEFSLEDDSYRHGVFTYYLVNGLQGEADANHDGKVTAQELKDFINDRVVSYARRKSSAQNPTFSPAFDPAFVLSIYSASGGVTTPTPQVPAAPPDTPITLGAALQPPPAASKRDVMSILRPEYSMKARSRLISANPQKFAFDVWLQLAPADRARIAKVVYDFVLASEPLHIESTDPSNGFSVAYDGWGCYSNVQVKVTLSNGIALTPATFNMCDALK
jgi:Caspase domain